MVNTEFFLTQVRMFLLNLRLLEETKYLPAMPYPTGPTVLPATIAEGLLLVLAMIPAGYGEVS